jgi:hypothetical protein
MGMVFYWHSAYVLSPTQMTSLRQWVAEYSPKANHSWMLWIFLIVGVSLVAGLSAYNPFVYLSEEIKASVVRNLEALVASIDILGFGFGAILLVGMNFSRSMNIGRPMSHFIEVGLGVKQTEAHLPRKYLISRMLTAAPERSAMLMLIGTVFSCPVFAWLSILVWQSQPWPLFETSNFPIWQTVFGSCITFVFVNGLASIKWGRLYLMHRRFRRKHGRPISVSDLNPVDPLVGDLGAI